MKEAVGLQIGLSRWWWWAAGTKYWGLWTGGGPTPGLLYTIGATGKGQDGGACVGMTTHPLPTGDAKASLTG